MKKKKIILSYDYELFFGDRSGTVQKSLIEPTNQLLDVMDSVGFKGNFFVDWQMIKYLSLEKDERCQQDHFAIVNQLKDMVRRGHRIELHIHPHWVDAKYNGDGTWNFDEFRHYSLNSFSKEEITEMFVEGTNLLESIAREVVPDYKIIAVRAGGWAVQPFEKLKEGFYKAGIKVDSSTSEYLYDFTDKCGFEKFNSYDLFRFNVDPTIIEVDGEFIEVPISTYFRGIIHKICYQYGKIFDKYECHTDGTHLRKVKRILPNTENKAVKSNLMLLSLSQLPALSVAYSILRAPHNIVCIIDHPKDLTSSTISGITLISKICDSINYNDITNNYEDFGLF